MAEYEDMINRVISEVKETNVDTAFGQSRQIGNQVVIPVAKISYGWGGGSGKGEKEEGDHEVEQGGGGMGMGVMVKPMGYIDVGPQGAGYRPIIDMTPILTVGAGIIGLAALKLARGLTKRKAA